MEYARQVVEKIVAGMVGTVNTVVQVPGDAPTDALGKTVSECSTKFLESLESTVGDAARATHKLVMRELAEFCAEKGITHVRQLTVALCDEFVESMVQSDHRDHVRVRSTLKTYAAKFGKFLSWCERKGHITERLAERLEDIEFEHVQAQPFTADEVEKLKDAATGTDRLLIELLSTTGLRISDALQFAPARLQDGEHMVLYRFSMQKRRRVKQPKWVETFISFDLRDRIMAARPEWLSREMPFKTKQALSTNYRRVYKMLQRLGDRCKVNDCRCHRFRDFFAVDLLERNVSIDDVSRLLHHESVTTTEKHYAAWTTGRARRLEGIIAGVRRTA